MQGWMLGSGASEGLPEGAAFLKDLASEHTISWVLIDIVIILVVARLVGALFRRIGQPPVVGEILAGLMLGPLFLGQDFFTDLFGLDQSITDSLFPEESRPFLKALAELGLIIFMFVVGLELDMKLIKGKERLAAGVSLTSVVLPFGLGCLLGATLLSDYAPDNDNLKLPFALFIGASMSVTAFPVLARILTERRMQGTAVGAVTLACAAIDDILAWSLLALVIAFVEVGLQPDGGTNPALVMAKVIGLTIVFGVFMSVVIKPILAKLNDAYQRAGKLNPDVLAVVLALLLMASWATSHIGIHSIFGAFALGVVFPRDMAEDFTHAVLERIESIAVLLLLPLFFIVTGLNARIPDGVELFEFLGVLAAVLIVACVGKFAGATIAGRIQGMSWRRSGAIGVLMNTRGLTELVLLSIGFDKGVLEGTTFTALVLMAIITTLMTSPLLKKIYPDRMIEHDIAEAERAALGDAISFRLLVAIDDPARSGPLVDVACRIAAAQQPAEIVLTSFEEQPESTGREISSFLETIASELDSLHELEEQVRSHGLAVQSLSQRTTSLAADIAAQATRVGARMVLVGDDRDDPEWSETVAELVAAGPADVGIVVAPLPRPGAEAPTAAPVVEAAEGAGGLTALEYGVRLGIPMGTGPLIVGLDESSRSAKRPKAVLARLAELGRPGRMEAATLDTVAGAEAAAGAVAVVRPFENAKGLEPVVSARPDAERFGCPVILVAPDPNQIERSSLETLLAETEPVTEAAGG